MKAAKAGLAKALERPDPAVRFYLFHGPDEAGSRALAVQLLRGLGNAEKFIVLGQSVKADPATLADEAGALALFGGKRATKLRTASRPYWRSPPARARSSPWRGACAKRRRS